jgi:hypothetical protein
MADGHQHFEGPYNLIRQDDMATLLKEARVSSKEIVPTYQTTLYHIPKESNIATITRTRNVAVVHAALSYHPVVALLQRRRC